MMANSPKPLICISRETQNEELGIWERKRNERLTNDDAFFFRWVSKRRKGIFFWEKKGEIQ